MKTLAFSLALLLSSACGGTAISPSASAPAEETQAPFDASRLYRVLRDFSYIERVGATVTCNPGGTLVDGSCLIIQEPRGDAAWVTNSAQAPAPAEGWACGASGDKGETHTLRVEVICYAPLGGAP